ncbi:GNAT family N-acetyltransferase [Shewanella sp. 3B26]|uniref:GNAT family N-acetyltransferase n=1 Tax=Shewanella zhuhaiensis TaxID=2919576 RepID=A0AAJ1BI42_9GAMM|nr:GNAT family N-acetyltransferase [Shewanella zhuhaiensis]MCH4295148.1 GNAT family N-acetyltransferase [Shewanella zhuhaiensis]
MNHFRVTTNIDDMDMAVIHGFLSQSYWAKGIPQATLQKALQNSLCFGLFDGEQQVGFARMVTDKATFAYLADVFVLESHRGHGGAKTLMTTIMDHTDLQGLRRMLLATRDAHSLYRQFGFTDLARPEIVMELHRPDIYQA